jgi:ribonuclease J
VQVYRACLQARKTLVVDVYVAHILKVLSEHAGIPYPSKEFRNIRVMFPWHLSNRLARSGNKDVLYQFTGMKITRAEIGENPAKFVLIVRPSLLTDLKKIKGMENGNFIYSLWKGYLDKAGSTRDFVEYFTNKGFALHHLHTSGHADLPTLKRLVSAVKPKILVPIHTLNGSEYKHHFDVKVREFSDGEVVG